MKVLILGGYGVFGGRLAELLSDVADMEIVISGRSQAKADAFCQALTGEAKFTPFAMDRNDLAVHLANLRVDFVVDASGPFQDYGDAQYDVVETCIQMGVHYLDFADAADFVFGISKFDAAAKQAGVCVLSGVSSFPVLSAAVLREMARDMAVVSVKGGIAPSPYAGVGMNVMRAVIGYAGGPLKLFRGGKTTRAYGLTESLRYTIAVPGKTPLRNLHFSLVEVPDLRVIPPLHPEMQEIWMGAGPGPEVLHRILNLLAKIRMRLHLPAMTPFAPLFYWVLNRMKFGEHRGGMFIHATGLKNGQPVERSWHLLAEGDDGPYIPSMAIEALLRQHLAGEAQPAGARPAVEALELADYDALFQGRSISMGFRGAADKRQPLFRQILGAEFDRLAPQLQALHLAADQGHWAGEAEVSRGNGLFSKWIAGFFGFPPAGSAVAVKVGFTKEKDGSEVWVRQFAKARFQSHLRAGHGRKQHLVLERFGLITVALALVHREGKLYFNPRSWQFMGIPLPRFLLPSGGSFEQERDGRFHFDIVLAAPLIGPIVSYKGWLEPAENHQSAAPATKL